MANYQAGAELVREEIILISKSTQRIKFEYLLLTNICKFDVHYTNFICAFLVDRVKSV
jgi:hypothetical protein